MSFALGAYVAILLDSIECEMHALYEPEVMHYKAAFALVVFLKRYQ